MTDREGRQGREKATAVTRSPCHPQTGVRLARAFTKTASASGVAAFTVTLSAAGTYTLTATNAASAVLGTQTVTVAAAAAAPAAAGTGLARTGFDALPLAAGGGILVPLGAGAVVVAKRRKSAHVAA